MNYFPYIKYKNDFSFKGEKLLFPSKKTMFNELFKTAEF